MRKLLYAISCTTHQQGTCCRGLSNYHILATYSQYSHISFASSTAQMKFVSDQAPHVTMSAPRRQPGVRSPRNHLRRLALAKPSHGLASFVRRPKLQGQQGAILVSGLERHTLKGPLQQLSLWKNRGGSPTPWRKQSGRCLLEFELGFLAALLEPFFQCDSCCSVRSQDILDLWVLHLGLGPSEASLREQGVRF